MNIRDEIRDEIFNSVDDEAEVDRIAGRYADLTDTADLPYGAQKLFAAAVAADAVLFLLTLFGMRFVRYFLDSVQIFAFGMIAAFVVGFFVTFSAYKIFKNDIQTDTEVRIDSGMMSGYMDQERDRRQFTDWLLGAGGSVLNMLVWFWACLTRG